MLHTNLLSDVELEAILSDQSFLQTAVDVECALVLARADCGDLSMEKARVIERALNSVDIQARELQEDAAVDGVFVPAMLKKLHRVLQPAEREFLHRGATSQDIIDTASVLMMKRALHIINDRLNAVGDKLAELSDSHADTLMVSRTRMQQAAVTTFGYKAACWLAPFTRHRQRLTELETRLYNISLGGASGNQSAFGNKIDELEQSFAQRLQLNVPLAPWHTQRDNMVELGNWLCLVANSTAKIAGDIILMGQSEIAEVSDQGGGSSSTLPQKSNPVRPEAIVSLAIHASTQLTSLHQSAQHQHERGGVAWQLEWLSLPQIIIASGTCLRLLDEVLVDLKINTDLMRQNLDRTQGRVLAEAATFLLANKMPLSEARCAVSDACKNIPPDSHLFDILSQQCSVDIDWTIERDPGRHVGRAANLSQKIVDQWQHE